MAMYSCSRRSTKKINVLFRIVLNLQSTGLENEKLTLNSLHHLFQACLFVNVSPDAYNFLESVSTLTFGSNARQVQLGQAKQNISKGK